MAGHSPFVEDPSRGELMALARAHDDHVLLNLNPIPVLHDFAPAVVVAAPAPPNVNKLLASSTRPSDAIITPPPHFSQLGLGLRQVPPALAPAAAVSNGPAVALGLGVVKAGAPLNAGDIANQVAAAVNRATVEISRTIIALNASFSHQIDSARLSASAGIGAAQSSANTTISSVMSTASSINSSAFSAVNVANLAVKTANSQMSSMSALLAADEASLATVSSTISSLSSALASDGQALASASLALSALSSVSSSDVFGLSQSIESLKSSLASEQVSFFLFRTSSRDWAQKRLMVYIVGRTSCLELGAGCAAAGHCRGGCSAFRR